MQTKSHFYTKNAFATCSRLSRLGYHSVTIRLPFGYHSQRHRRGTAKKWAPSEEEAHFWDYLVMLVVLVALVVLDKLDCI